MAAGTAAGQETTGFTPPGIEELARKFPQLELIELIGRGGMGAVYKARQKELDRIVALKILPPAIGDDAAFAERFAREAKALAKLNHPGIITIHDFGRSDGLYFFVMEFVDGVDLQQLLASGRVSSREALAIVPQICDALQFAHDHGIVHRDIKPGNILLDRHGRVKVADFGLAKIVGRSPDPRGETSAAAEAPAPSDLTGVGRTIGTPAYMAPEQVKHPAEVDHRADIYALGVVFYQMLTGELPGKPIQPPSSKVQIDVRLDQVVLRALEKKPELRYQQIGAFKTQVETIAATSGPSNESAPKSDILPKVSPCYLSTPKHLRSLRGRLLWIYQGKGELRLDRETLCFQSSWPTVAIPLASIRTLALGDYPLSAKPLPIHYIAVTFTEGGVSRTLLFTPVRSWVMSPWEANKVVAEWLSALQQAIRACTGRTLAVDHSDEAANLSWWDLAKTLFLSAAGMTVAFSVIPLVVHHRLPNQWSELWPGPIFAAVLMAGFLVLRWWQRQSTAVAKAGAALVGLVAVGLSILFYNEAKADHGIPKDWSVLSGHKEQWVWANHSINGHSTTGDSILGSSRKYGDVTLSVIAGSTNRGADLAIRMQDADNGYIVVFIPDGTPWAAENGSLVKVEKRTAGESVELAKFNRRGLPQSAKITVIAKGPWIEVRLNGDSVLKVHDTTYTSGFIGLRIYGDPVKPGDATFSSLTFEGVYLTFEGVEGRSLDLPDHSRAVKTEGQDNLRPRVVSVAPASGAAGVKCGTELHVRFDRPMDPLSLKLSWESGGFLDCDYPKYDSDKYEFTIPVHLVPGTLQQIVVNKPYGGDQDIEKERQQFSYDGFLSVDRRLAGLFVWQFQTEDRPAVAGSKPPEPTVISPAPGSQVPIRTFLEIQFDQPMMPPSETLPYLAFQDPLKTGKEPHMISRSQYEAATHTFHLFLLLPPNGKSAFTVTGFRSAAGVPARPIALNYQVSDQALAKQDREMLDASASQPRLLALLETMKQRRLKLTSLAEHVQSVWLNQRNGLFYELDSKSVAFKWQEPDQYCADISMLMSSDCRFGSDRGQWWWYAGSKDLVVCPANAMNESNVVMADPFDLSRVTPRVAAAENGLRYLGDAKAGDTDCLQLEGWRIIQLSRDYGYAPNGSLIQWWIDSQNYRPVQVTRFNAGSVWKMRFTYDSVNQPLPAKDFAVPELAGRTPKPPDPMLPGLDTRFIYFKDGSSGDLKVEEGERNAEATSFGWGEGYGNNGF